MSDEKAHAASRVKAVTISYLLEALLSGPQTIKDLTEVTGLHRTTVGDYIRAFRRRKIMHIADWEADATGRDKTPVFKLGRGKDMRRRRMTAEEVRLRDKQRKDRRRLAKQLGVLR